MYRFELYSTHALELPFPDRFDSIVPALVQIFLNHHKTLRQRIDQIGCSRACTGAGGVGGALISGCDHTYIHTYKHTYMHTCIHTYIHIYKHIYLHTELSQPHILQCQLPNWRLLCDETRVLASQSSSQCTTD